MNCRDSNKNKSQLNKIVIISPVNTSFICDYLSESRSIVTDNGIMASTTTPQLSCEVMLLEGLEAM